MRLPLIFPAYHDSFECEERADSENGGNELGFVYSENS